MLPDILIDALFVLSMFVLRIGVPLAITLALGYWLEKKLQSDEASRKLRIVEPVRRTANPSKASPLHCWDVRRCDPASRAQCPAFQRPALPCWLALQVAGGKAREDCFSCALYKPQAMAA